MVMRPAVCIIIGVLVTITQNQNDRHELMHLTLTRLYAFDANAFIDIYNNERPHEALDMNYVTM